MSSSYIFNTTFLNKYIRKFRTLRVDKSKGYPAPHKPILLLSVIEGFEKNEIKENKIFITPELVSRYKDYWAQLVDNLGFRANFSLPYFHLRSEGFWHLRGKENFRILLTSSGSIKSLSYLKEVVDFVWVDIELFELLQIKSSREILKGVLLASYFSNSILENSNKYLQAILTQILHDPPALYKEKVKYSDEDELFVRGAVFKKEIPKIYNYSCSISGMRIITDSAIQMIDACHIVPFSESNDDTITNGICLCPNLHRAFDRGLISITNEYRVIVKKFHENVNGYSIKQFENKKIILPNIKEYRPSIENLKAHRIKHKFE